MLRRRLLPSLLALCLLLTAQGGMLHALEHLRAASAASLQSPPLPAPETGSHRGGDAFCALCLAFGALGSVPPAHATVDFPPALADTAAPTAIPVALPGVETTPYQSRAPPPRLARSMSFA